MKEKLTFSKIEILFMIVMVALVIIAGTTVFTITTRNQIIPVRMTILTSLQTVMGGRGSSGDGEPPPHTHTQLVGRDTGNSY